MSAFAKTRTGEKNSFYGKHHSDASKKLLSEKLRAMNLQSPISKKVEIDGVVYPSCRKAEFALGLSRGVVAFRIKSKNPEYSVYRYV